MTAQQIKENSPNDREILEAFEVFDPSRAGTVSAEELKQYFLSSRDFTEKEVQEILNSANPGPDGQIKYYQLVKSVLGAI